MASSAPSSPARPRRLQELQNRPPLLTTHSSPSSPSSSSTTSAFLSPRRPRTNPSTTSFMAPPSITVSTPVLVAAAAAAAPGSRGSATSSTPIPTPPPSTRNIAGTLRVEVISARNLHAAVLGSLLKWTANTSNPYVVITLHRDEFTTTTKEQTLNPTWKEMGTLSVPLPSEQELLQTVGMHRSVYDTGSGVSADATGKLLAGVANKLNSKMTGNDGTSSDFHACFPHLRVQVFHRADQVDGAQAPGSPRSRRAQDKLIGEVSVPILPCLMSSTSSHRSWYTLLSDEHPDAGQIQLAMNYDVGGPGSLEPLKGDIVRLAGFGGMEYYAKLVNANARLEVVDVFQDQVLVQYKSIENWMLSFEVHRNMLFVVRRPSIIRDATNQLTGQIVRVGHSPLVTKARQAWQIIPVSQRRQLHDLYELAVLSGGAAYTVVSKSVDTTLNQGVQAGVKTCLNGSSEAVNQVSHEALRRFWYGDSRQRHPQPTRTEEMKRYLEGGPLSGRGKVVQAFGEPEANLDDEEKMEESEIVFTVDPEDEEPETFEAEETRTETLHDDDEEKTNEDDADGGVWGDDVPEQLICPITGCPMIDPVVAADGHTYEREAILQWFSASNKSPMTGAQMETTQVFPNISLKRMSQELQEKRKAAMRGL